MFSAHIASEHSGKILSASLHPGIVRTNMQKGAPLMQSLSYKLFGYEVE